MFGRKGHVKPAWSYKASGVLWRLVPAAGGILISEVRDVDRKQTSFAALDERTGKPLWRDKSFGEDWWIGIEAVGNSVLFLHLFATPELPEHRGIIAVDTGSGELLWSERSLKFEWLEGDVVTASRSSATGSETVRLDSRSGTLMKGNSQSRLSAEGGRDDVIAPIPITGVSSTSNPAAGLLRSSITRTLLGDVAEYIEYGEYLVFCYVAGTPGENQQIRAEQYITVANRQDGSVVYDALMNENIAAIMPGNFFVAGGMLLYVRGRSELIALHLQHVNPESTKR